MKRLRILNIPIDIVTEEQAAQRAFRAIEEKHPFRIITANAEMLMQAQTSESLNSSLQSADLVVADGAGVVWAAKELGSFLPERVAGIDLAHRILNLSAQKQIPVFFFGGAPEIAEEAAKKMIAKYPGLRIAGIQDGFLASNDETVLLKKINTSGAQILFVALGVPKQEEWLDKYKNELIPSLRVGVGGSFDVMADRVTRAPLWMQKNSLEWFYRLLCQPSRWRRMLAIPQFIFKVKGSKQLDKA